MPSNPGADAPTDGDLFVSPEGNDGWSGEIAEPADDEGDGPFATIQRAQRAVRERKDDARLDGGMTVWLRGGRYRLEEPLSFGPADSAPVTYAAYPGEQPIIDGASELTGWAETTVNGVDAWKTTIEAVREGEWAFNQLFVDGERRPRPRVPKAVNEVFEEGEMVGDDEERFYHFQEGTQQGRGPEVRTFEPEADSIDPEWHAREHVDVVAINKWYDERAPIEAVGTEGDAVTDVTVAFRPYPGKEWPDRFYYLENVFEALTEPGEWYLDRGTGECYYLPREGESMADVTISAPRARQLLRVEGAPAENEFVEFLGFEGLIFEHTAWEHWVAPEWITGQSGAPTVGALTLSGVRNCSFEQCTVRTVGEYALDVREGCTGVRVAGCELHDLGAGGIKLGTYSSDPDAPDVHTGKARLVDNHIHDTGRIFHLGAGILAMDTYGNTIAHNHIHDTYYSAISVGWNWGYEEQIARDNHVEHNYLHDLGQGLLSDMAGVYTLGVQPGTVVRGTHVHDVWACDYGGWGLYTDEGSSHILLEKNLAHDTNRQAFHQHYGRENLLRNNVFAFGQDGQVTLSRAEEHNSFTAERNIIVTEGAPIFQAGYGWDLEGDPLISDLNLVWDTEGNDLVCGQRGSDGDSISFEAWRERGHDRHSVVAPPGFEDLEGRDFTLSEESPALDLGFEPFDVSNAGPRLEPGATSRE